MQTLLFKLKIKLILLLIIPIRALKILLTKLDYKLIDLA